MDRSIPGLASGKDSVRRRSRGIRSVTEWRLLFGMSHLTDSRQRLSPPGSNSRRNEQHVPEEQEEDRQMRKTMSYLSAATLMSAVAVMAADSVVGNCNTVDEKTGKIRSTVEVYEEG